MLKTSPKTDQSSINVYCRADSHRRIQADLDSFLREVEKSGVNPEGRTLCNAEVDKMWKIIFH